jgi:hypothetical protein
MQLPDPRFVSMGLVLAQELGDAVTSARLRARIEEWCEPRFFGSDDGEFGFWFKLGEEYPRGQLSAFLILGELVDQGSWWRLFNQPDLAKFREPVVAGVDYPKIGLLRAFNDADAVLHFTTYAATASHRGQPTSFRVENLTSPATVSVRRDGAPYERWRVSADNAIEVDSEIEGHDFDVLTGGKDGKPGPSATVNATRPADPPPSTASLPPSAGVSAAAMRDAGLLLISGAGTCPCCV